MQNKRLIKKNPLTSLVNTKSFIEVGYFKKSGSEVHKLSYNNETNANTYSCLVCMGVFGSRKKTKNQPPKMGLGLWKVFHPLVQNVLFPSNTGIPEKLLRVYSLHFIIKVVYVLVFEFTSEFYNVLVGESPLLGHIVMECYIGYVDASLDFHQPANSSILIIHIIN